MGAAAARRRTYDQPCPAAHALDLVGERWTLLIVRDLLFGPLRFTDLREGLPGLAPNLLSDRLRFLADQGLIEREECPPPAARTVYVLTARGRELGPVVHELSRFGVADWPDPDEHPPPLRLLRGALLALMTPSLLGPASWVAAIELPEATILVTVRDRRPGMGDLDRLRLRHQAPVDAPTGAPSGDPGSPAGPGGAGGPDGGGGPVGGETAPHHPDVSVRTTLGTLRELRRGRVGRQEAMDSGSLEVVGELRVQRELGTLMGWD